MLKERIQRLWNRMTKGLATKSDGSARAPWHYYSLVLVAALLVVWTALGLYWSNEPDQADVSALTQQYAEQNGHRVVVGYTTTHTLAYLTETLLDKPGGYLSNDVTPPSILLDNMPSWEFGVIVQLRDLSRAMRKDMTRSQSQSAEDVDLSKAEPLLHFNHNSWMLPSTEGEYRTAVRHIRSYQARLADTTNQNAQFYARADNLAVWLRDVETRLGSMSQRLSASVGQSRFNTDADAQATPSSDQPFVKTPRLQVDNVFYEARGTAWALIHILKAIEVDFAAVLEDKNALVSFQQIIRELEGTQERLMSPIVLNGGGFGMMANHSLVMANYISRANAAIIDLRELLQRG